MPEESGNTASHKTEALVEEVSQSLGSKDNEKENKVGTLCKLCADKDLVIFSLYLLTLLFSCLYYRQTGKHSDEIESSLVHLAGKLSWKQRLILCIAAWIQRLKRGNKQ